tara:strand:+ start:1719 stop:2309 length:591 start_codon:yes stop_codon:yes gene_type:complete
MDENTYTSHIDFATTNIAKLPSRDEIQSEIKLFSSYDRVVFCTMGKSAFACRKIVHTARSYGLQWYDLDVCHAFHGDAGIIKRGDLLVLVSKSGETKETVQVSEYFSDWEKIVVCSNTESTLSKTCNNNIIIPIKVEGSPFGYAPMISTVMYSLVLHGILTEVIKSKDCKVEEYARNHPSGKIGEMIKNDPTITKS